MHTKNENGSPVIFQEERRDRILKILERENRVTTKDLCKKFETTPVTIRKDLALLEKKGSLKRTHGGAIKNRSLFPGLALSKKEKLFLDEKIKIVKTAARLISEGDTIVLDSGSTVSLLAKEIKHLDGITVITNAMNIASELAQGNIEVILTGGSLQKESATLIGPLAEEVIRRVSAGKLFFGVDGIDFETGLTTPNILEANTTRTMMSVSGEKILLVDSSKFERRSLGVICGIKDIDKVITTKNLTDAEILKFANCGVETIVL